MNFWDVLILAVLAVILSLAVRTLRGKKESGGCSCGCGRCLKDCPSRRSGKLRKTNS